MSFDGIVTKSIVEQLQKLLINGKINKINQPEKNSLVFNIYNNKNNYKLLIDASSNSPRINITKNNFENPVQAPNFCMLLRKHIQGGSITNIEQVGLDRVIKIDVKSLDELGDFITKTLIIELMGKYSNIILTYKKDQKIIDSIKRITLDLSRIRQVLPGMEYSSIPDNKTDIMKEKIYPSEIISKLEKPVKLSRLFYMNYTGFSPQLGKEISYRANLDSDIKTSDLSEDNLKLIDLSFKDISNSIINKEYKFNIYKDSNNNYLDFHIIKLNHLGENYSSFENVSELIDDFYSQTTISDKVGQKISNLQKKVKTILNRNLSKLEKLKQEEVISSDREKYKVWADLISANSHLIKRGQTILEAENFYDPDLSLVEIKLDETKSPWENAQFYYKKYSKLKTSNKLLKTQIPKLESEIAYIYQVLESLKYINSNNEIDEIRDELESNGYLKKRKKPKIKSKPSLPLHYKNKNNNDIYIGKNNYQNDYLTLKFANKNDYFLHAKDVPGSHVILRGNNIVEEDIYDASMLAAYYSSQSQEDHVLVDYTLKKNVRKAKHAKPGMVYYDNYETKMVNLKEFNIDNYKKIEK
ncbi:Rqc2 family fibronectin-binding protein [Miniphocaeibacter halophilus]|uniref:NFACT family protein n=1 Tax=Miniphocaeibacter halophilus TaxID=2931922 RepID=A0AC61MQ42_9FIRM|nr:NFACT RNA binding domain-containing protein [Miniphocaeibacter halophilus]QQK07767.1 NFACT family protein [Miniphocaeibacter halophilus]